MANINHLFERRFFVQMGFPGIEDFGIIEGEILGADYHHDDYERLQMLLTHPKIFRELEWQEYRMPNQMPAYLKNSIGEVYRVSKWINHGTWLWSFERDGVSTWLLTQKPATEDEIIDYLHKTKTR